MRPDLFRTCANLVRISLTFIRALTDPLWIGSPIQYQMCSLVKVIWLKLRLHSAVYQLRFYSNLLIHILSLSTSHNNVALIQKNRGDKSHSVIVAVELYRFRRVCASVNPTQSRRTCARVAPISCKNSITF